MTHPAIIRTDFATAEEAADVYGISRKHVERIRRALGAPKKMAAETRSGAEKQHAGGGTDRQKASRGTKSRGKKK